MDSQSKEAQGQGIKKLAKQHLTKKQGAEGGQALRRAQHLTNPSEETHRQRCKHSLAIMVSWWRVPRVGSDPVASS
jgi:hypothetical protein